MADKEVDRAAGNPSTGQHEKKREGKIGPRRRAPAQGACLDAIRAKAIR